MSGRPYKHSMTVHPFLKKTTFQITNSHQFYPVADKSKWPLLLLDNVQPPLIIESAGKTQTKKKKEFSKEKFFKMSSIVKCSRYSQWASMQSLKVKKVNLK